MCHNFLVGGILHRKLGNPNEIISGYRRTHTEAQARAFSWGLMQVMGQVAREHNFGAADVSSGNSMLSTVAAPLTRLCDPATGLDIGCTVFSAKLSAAHRDVTRTLQLWNGGGNPNYPAQVLARVGQYT